MSSKLTFAIQVSPGVHNVSLFGSWDNYTGRLPLTREKSTSKTKNWSGTFIFPSSTLQAGWRYWYYYLLDDYHYAHNPSEKSVVEVTTGRRLNIMDMPQHPSRKSTHHHKPKHLSQSQHPSATFADRRSEDIRSKRLSLEIPKGRPLSVSQIKAPIALSPVAASQIFEQMYDESVMDELSNRLAQSNVSDGESSSSSYSRSPTSASTGSSRSRASGNSSPLSSLSGYSTPISDYGCCTCNRFGITRGGARVRLDCSGTRCGYVGESSCSSSEDELLKLKLKSSSRHKHNDQSSKSSRSGKFYR